MARHHRPLLKLITLAPEVDITASMEVIRAGVEKKIAFFIGHSGATGQMLEFAMNAGAIGWTHLGNAAPAHAPKFDNVIMHALSHPELYASLIPDGLHVPNHAFRVMARSLQKGHHAPRLLLTTDAMSGPPRAIPANTRLVKSRSTSAPTAPPACRRSTRNRRADSPAPRSRPFKASASPSAWPAFSSRMPGPRSPRALLRCSASPTESPRATRRTSACSRRRMCRICWRRITGGSACMRRRKENYLMPPPPYKPQSIQPPVSQPVLRKSKSSTQKERIEDWAVAIVLIFITFGAFFFFACLIGYAGKTFVVGIGRTAQDRSVQAAQEIASAMNAYASDHKGVYPDGLTSTEVFQKLIDGKYLTDPGIFYLQMAGKNKATSARLTANNVCYDVTSGVTADSSDQLPMVFCTGYEVSYFSGDSAIRNIGRATPFPGRGRIIREIPIQRAA